MEPVETTNGLFYDYTIYADAHKHVGSHYWNTGGILEVIGSTFNQQNGSGVFYWDDYTTQGYGASTGSMPRTYLTSNINRSRRSIVENTTTVGSNCTCAKNKTI